MSLIILQLSRGIGGAGPRVVICHHQCHRVNPFFYLPVTLVLGLKLQKGVGTWSDRELNVPGLRPTGVRERVCLCHLVQKEEVQEYTLAKQNTS